MSCDCSAEVAAEPTPKDGESHEEYMSRCMEMGYTEDECMKAHEGYEFEVEGYYDDDEKKKKKYASEDCGCGCKGAEVAYEDWEEVDVEAAEYQGRKVTLNKPFRTSGASKKFGVYTKNEKGNVVLVRFGDPNMEIKRDDPERRKNFRSRHNCDSPGPKWKARYWSCRQWRGGKKVEADEEVEAKDADDPCTEGYEQYGMKMKNGRKVPNCIPIKQKAEAAYDVCATCMTQDACAEAKSCKAEAAYDSCPPGKEMVDGKCKVISVTLDLDIDESKAVVVAETGKTVIEISGVAFHEGMNKNKWSLTPQGAKAVVEQMTGADLTLLHPKADENGAGFTRNMDGGMEEAVVGYIVGANFFTTDDGYEVRYVAHVTREELFGTFDEGLWMRDGYGVSIGGSGVPVEADENGLIFGEDFTFDHLALVRKPAYERANVEKATKKQVKLPSIAEEETIISHSVSEENQPTVIAMTEETNEIDYEAEMESLKADLVLATSRIAEYEAVEAQRVEDERMALVEKATELGMSGHDDLKSETLETLIASWESSHPEPSPVEMTPVESVEKPVEASAVASEEIPTVANYLNGRMVSNDERIYAKAWNAWASAWNQTLATDEKARMHAISYESKKEMI
tara:strand:+ start:814 stop:2691 length:1878 start_codon:yes stop_codon:yes gene_type:complete